MEIITNSRIFIVGVLLFVSSSLTAQNKALVLLKEMNLTYLNASTYSMTVHLKSMNGGQVVHAQEGQVKYHRKQMFSTFNGMTMLLNQKYFVTIDEQAQIVLVQDIKEEDLAKMQEQIDVLTLLDESLSDLDIAYLGKQEGCLLYTSPSPRDATLSRMPSSA